MRLITLLALTTCAGCRSQQPIVIESYAQANKMVPQYVRHYSAHHKPVPWLGPPPGAAVRLQRRHPGQEAVLRGHIGALLDNGQELPQPAAIVVVDGSITYADEAGNYAVALAPGWHQVRAGGIGFLSAEAAPLQVEGSDSLCLDFRLLQDLRPISCQ